MTTTLPRRRRPRDVNTKRADLQQSPGGKGSTLPEYLEAHEVSALIAAAPNPQARLLTLEQWRAGLRVSEAWRWSPPTCARPPTGGPCGSGKTMGKNPVKCPCVLSCMPPLPLLPATARPVAAPLVDVSRTTAWRWVQLAAKRAIDAGQLDRVRHVGTHTLRHSYARHLLLNGIPLNYLSRWLGHPSIQTTLIYFVKGGGKLDRADTTKSQSWQTLIQSLPTLRGIQAVSQSRRSDSLNTGLLGE